MDKNFKDRKMYKVDCSQCGEVTEVPFKPDGERPVYCKKCYKPKNKTHKNNTNKNFGSRSKMKYEEEEDYDDDY